MNKPSKKQLVDAVIHYQTALNSLVEGPALSAEDLLEEVKAVIRNAPSLEPQPKAVVEVPVVEEPSVDPEAPAVA